MQGETLHIVAAPIRKQSQRGWILDTFRNGAEVERFSKIKDSVHYLLVASRGSELFDERTVNFQRGDRKLS